MFYWRVQTNRFVKLNQTSETLNNSRETTPSGVFLFSFGSFSEQMCLRAMRRMRNCVIPFKCPNMGGKQGFLKLFYHIGYKLFNYLEAHDSAIALFSSVDDISLYFSKFL